MVAFVTLKIEKITFTLHRLGSVEIIIIVFFRHVSACVPLHHCHYYVQDSDKIEFVRPLNNFWTQFHYLMYLPTYYIM